MKKMKKILNKKVRKIILVEVFLYVEQMKKI